MKRNREGQKEYICCCIYKSLGGCMCGEEGHQGGSWVKRFSKVNLLKFNFTFCILRNATPLDLFSGLVPVTTQLVREQIENKHTLTKQIPQTKKMIKSSKFCQLFLGNFTHKFRPVLFPPHGKNYEFRF